MLRKRGIGPIVSSRSVQLGSIFVLLLVAVLFLAYYEQINQFDSNINRFGRVLLGDHKQNLSNTDKGNDNDSKYKPIIVDPGNPEGNPLKTSQAIEFEWGQLCLF